MALPAYFTIDEVTPYMPKKWSRRQVRDALVTAGVTRNLSATPGRKGRRTVVVTEQLRLELPEVYKKLFDASLEH